jgi:hypothetical protein
VLSSRRPIGVVILALVLALAGCSSGDSGNANGGAQDSGDSGAAKPAPPKGAEPVAWVGAFCSGLSEVIVGATALGKAETTPQGQKDGLLAFADSSQRAMSETARKLEQVGSPGIADGQRIHDTVVGFFKAAGESIADQRAKLAELDPNDPQFGQNLSRLAGPDLSAASGQVQQLTSNPELLPAFRASPQCQQLGGPGAPR